MMIAERLLEVSRVYEPAYQLALDMLFRLNAVPQLLTVLLTNLEVHTALKLVTPRSPFFDEKVYYIIASTDMGHITYHLLIRVCDQVTSYVLLHKLATIVVCYPFPFVDASLRLPFHIWSGVPPLLSNSVLYHVQIL
jgi:hypothetical protein